MPDFAHVAQGQPPTPDRAPSLTHAYFLSYDRHIRCGFRVSQRSDKVPIRLSACLPTFAPFNSSGHAAWSPLSDADVTAHGLGLVRGVGSSEALGISTASAVAWSGLNKMQWDCLMSPSNQVVHSLSYRRRGGMGNWCAFYQPQESKRMRPANGRDPEAERTIGRAIKGQDASVPSGQWSKRRGGRGGIRFVKRATLREQRNPSAEARNGSEAKERPGGRRVQYVQVARRQTSLGRARGTAAAVSKSVNIAQTTIVAAEQLPDRMGLDDARHALRARNEHQIQSDPLGTQGMEHAAFLTCKVA
ncbi:hypothetical protein MYCTH_2129781 [Thermothelomyces thermophilus ATCC 42464]|uniref:Uncharacterized protein n=1 Tax=Thermothelomyces thermophilus (strain ATCC 42464 / BCRC 31852 / DSM 1799) TaxID=573729 RepID=G2QL22_THET4|nr:uncharacterized protein MYCTH_2129781 [Thermothelomyces thermophilus ATCC 42464]AEO60654.1 hypothetical protein MYCTH_2129781 [Thermothelomyces thermophilus ATCC 42464]